MLERRTAWCRGQAGSVALFVLAHRQGLPTDGSQTCRRDPHVHGPGQSFDVHRHCNRHERERHE